MALSTDLSALNTALGAYNRKYGTKLLTQLLLGLFEGENSLAGIFTKMDDITDEFTLPRLDVADLVKPADSSAFTPTSNALKFDARILKVRRWKVDLQIRPEEYEKSFASYNKTKGSLNEKKMVLEEYIMQEVLKRVKVNLRQAIFQGTYNASGTTVNAIMDGINTFLTAAIAGSTVTPATLPGTVDATNISDSILSVYDMLGDAYQNTELVALMPTAWAKLLTRSQTLTNEIVYEKRDNGIYLPNTNCRVVGEPYHNVDRIIITSPDNLIIGMDTESEYNQIRTQEFDRTIKMLMDGKIGFQVKEIRDTNRPLAVGE